jgi:LacI family transcriptional regulator
MPTIHDVARLAGVAPITVSRVINHSGYISRETRERVETAIAELGYVPNTLARSLRLKRTHTLALVLTDITNPFFTQVARGVEDVASDAGFTVIYCNTDESEDEEIKYLNVLLQKQVDGILMVPAQSSSKSVGLIQDQGSVVVVIDRRLVNVKADVVRCNSEDGAYQLVRHLQHLGHQRIMVISGPSGVSTAEDRVAGYRRAMEEAGLNTRVQLAELIWRGAFNQESGYKLTQQAMAANPPPTALFAANNFIAIGALKALRDANLNVPEDVSLVAFDDLPGMLVEPFLTVAAQPAYEMGRQATELLLKRLENGKPEQWQEIVLPVDIIQRKSTAPPNLLRSLSL